jgi:hypothetical protein
MLSHQALLVLTTLLPAEAHPRLASGLTDGTIDEFWSEFERTALPGPRVGFQAAFFTATWIAPLLIRRLPPLSLHDDATRARALNALGKSRLPILRQMLGLLKTIASFCYGADPDVRAAIGYPHPSADNGQGAVP